MKKEQSRIDTIEVSKGEYIAHIVFSYKNSFGKEVITEEYWCGEFLSSRIKKKNHFYTRNYSVIGIHGYAPATDKEALEAFAKTEVDRIIEGCNYPRIVNSVVYP
jgi:hypothetical protein